METDKLAQKLTHWIKEKIDAAGAKGAVFGLSGGIDSSVIASLCIQAFPQTSLGLIMPCHSQHEDAYHAELVAKTFSVPTRFIPLDGIVDEYLKVLPDITTDPLVKRLAQANLKARMRMVTLYYTANQLNYLVVGSGNRSELTTGYFTKFGDSGIDILPIGNLVKKQVRELAQCLKVPQPVIDKPPSAGLWAGQTDEGEMGFTYEALDNYILTGKAPADIRKRIDSMNARSAHKRAIAPIPDF
jgi:NAD+ synthase